MGKRIFSTEYAPAEEIEGVKKCLDNAGVPYYEVANSKLWLGGGALYVSDPADYQRARDAIDKFQAGWRAQSRLMPVARLNWALVLPLLVIFLLFLVVTVQSLL